MHIVSSSRHFCLWAFIISASLLATDALPQNTLAIDNRNPPPGYVAPKATGPVDMSMAKYARDSFLDGEEGVVDLRLLVRRDGSVGETQVERSSGSARLDKYATDLVKEWQFQPATVNGSAVDSWHLVNVVWALQTLDFSVPHDVLNAMTVFYTNSPAGISRVSGIATARILVDRRGDVRKVVIEKRSGHASIDDLMRKFLASTRINFPPGASGDAAWLRMSMGWGFDRIVEKDACLQSTPSSLDATIAACSGALNEGSMTPYERAMVYLERGEAHIAKHEFDLAVADFDSGIRISPGISDLFIDRGVVRFNQNQWDLAMSDLDSAVMVEPLKDKPYVTRAAAYLKDGDVARAMIDYRNALTMVPPYAVPGAYADVCYSLAANGRPQEALVGCDKAVSMQSGNATFLATRGHVHLKLQQYDLAVSDYDAALRTGERVPAALYGRGIAKLRRGDRSGAADVDTALKQDPNVGNAMLLLGLMP